MADVNKTGTTALESAPSPIKRLLSSIKPVFSTYSGASKGVGPQPNSDDPIAGVPVGSPNQVLVTNPTKFNQSPRQVALHESIHTIQNNLTPEQQKEIPPDTGNPLVVTDPNYLAAQRKAGKTILQLPREQQSYLVQYHDSKKEAYEKGYITKKEMDEIDKIYGPWIKDFDKAKLSTVIPTDPNSLGNTIVTTPRAPLTPVDLQQSTVQFNPTGDIPVTTDGSVKPVDWMGKGQKLTGFEGIPRPITSVRPSKQVAQPSTAVSQSKPQFKVNKEDEKVKNKWGHGFEPDYKPEPRNLQDQLIQARIASVNNPAHKNPFAFTHPLDQQAATFAKAQRIIKNQDFAKLPNERKAIILSNYYDKYVAPVYKNAGIDAPHKDIWIKEVQTTNFSVQDFYIDSGAANKDAVSDAAAVADQTGAAAVKLGAHLTHFLTKTIGLGGVQVDRAQLGIANFFPGSVLQNYAKGQLETDQKILKKTTQMSQNLIDDTTFWQDTHPTRSFQEKAGSYVGEAAIQLPLYEALSVVRIGMLGKAIATTGTMGKSANLTRALATSKLGQFAAKRLGEAADAYIGDTFSETPKGDRALDMAAFMGFGAITEGIGALVKPIAKATIKKIAANNIATGGRVFHDTVTDQAAYELEHNIIGADAAGEPINHNPNDPTHFEYGMEAAHQADPIKQKIVTAEKISMSAVARDLYGKPMNQLSALQRRRVRVTMARIANEATVEMPIHVPEVSKHEIETKLHADVAANPSLANTFNEIEQLFGQKVVDAVHQTEVESIKAETGIKSPQAATAKAANKIADLAQPKTRAQQIFQEFGDRGNAKYNYRDESFDIKFDSPVDLALYRLQKGAWKKTKYGEMVQNKTYYTALEKLKRYFPGKSQGEILTMAEQVKDKADALVAERRNDPTYKNNTHSNPTELKFESTNESSEKKEVEDFNETMSPFKTNYPDEYNAGLKELAKLQSLSKKLKPN